MDNGKGGGRKAISIRFFVVVLFLMPFEGPLGPFLYIYLVVVGLISNQHRNTNNKIAIGKEKKKYIYYKMSKCG